METTTATSPFLQLLQANIGKHLTESLSPYARWLNGKLLKAEKGETEVSFLVRNDMTNPMGILHGGVTSGIIDDVMGMTAFTVEENVFNATINLSVDYFAAVQEGETVIAKTKVERSGRRLTHIVCEVYKEDGKLVARGQSNCIKSKMGH